jgi:hypothetical protein
MQFNGQLRHSTSYFASGLHFNGQHIDDTFGLAPIILDGKSLVGGAITNAVFAYTEELLN